MNAAVAQAREQKIRNIFQKYVPRSVIETYFANPEKMLVGENRVLSVLFTDIRGFTGISEKLRPDEIVDSLNDYFRQMVDIIMNRDGIVDKYIGDAIMAIFGAPVRHEDDALQSVLAALEMLEGMEKFNTAQKRLGRAPWKIGIGINYGTVTVGNIGSERKMDYTVIGDMVNLASRLEGLTKKYHEPLIVSDSVQRKIAGTLPCRLLDRVAVKGRAAGTSIYAVRRAITGVEEKAWTLQEEALGLYYERQFGKADGIFKAVLQMVPEDHCAGLFQARCAAYARVPPPEGWTGVEEMREK
jgi:class 3 adenylate cyclase